MTETSILTGPERRRRWREADRLRIVEETCAPGGSISEVARRHDISRSRIYAWRREFRVAQNPTFFPVVVPGADSQSGPEAETALVLDLHRPSIVSIGRQGSGRAHDGEQHN
jgi:transposase